MFQQNIFVSLKNKARQYYYYNILLPKNRKKIKALKDCHKGERCFIVCNGPSLKAEDLTRLHNNGEHTFAMNRIYLMFDKTPWRPEYYACQDILIIDSKRKEINALQAGTKFIPAEFWFYNNIKIDNANYFHVNYGFDADEKTFGISEDCADHINDHGTVTFSCIQLAIYMGFSKIYLIGCDNNYTTTIDENGKIVTDNSVKDYFVDGYDDDIKEKVVHNTGSNKRVYGESKQYCDAHDVTIYNATRGGKLEVFERVDLDTLF